MLCNAQTSPCTPGVPVQKFLSEFTTNPNFGDGISFDDEAFEKAALWFNNRTTQIGSSSGVPVFPLNVDYAAGCTGELIIDYWKPNTNNTVPAVYMVGKQYSYNDTYYVTETGGERTIPTRQDYFAAPGPVFPFLKRGNDLFTISKDVNGLYIHSSLPGQKVKIKYADNLYYGAWCPPDYRYYQVKNHCYNPTLNPLTDFCYTMSAVPTGLPYGLDASNSAPIAATAYNNIWPGHGCNTCTPTSPASCQCVYSSNPTVMGMIVPETRVDFYNPSLTDPAMLPIQVNEKFSVDPYTFCTPGNFFVIKGCNVKLEDIELDGNNQKCKYGRFINDGGGVQWPHDAIKINVPYTPGQPYLRNVEIKNVDAHHFGGDGLIISGENVVSSDCTPLAGMQGGIRLDDCHFDYNLRQGISWTTGREVHANRVTCSNQSAVHNYNLLGNMNGNPGSGMDIEPDVSGQVCADGFFTDCDFIGNAGNALTNDGYNVANPTRNMHFTHCNFLDVKGWCLSVRGENYTFTDCHISGRCDIGYRGTDPLLATRFYQCRFDDDPIDGVYNTDNGPLIFALNPHRMAFDECTFTVNDPTNREMFYFNWFPVGGNLFNSANSWPDDETSIFTDCQFFYNSPGNSSWGFLYSVRFNNDNYFKSKDIQMCSGRILNMRDIHVGGLVAECKPAELTFDGQMNVRLQGLFDIGRVINTTGDGYANVILKNNALFSGMTGATITDDLRIRPRSKFHVHANCGIAQTNIELKGDLVFDDYSYFHQAGNSYNKQITGVGTAYNFFMGNHINNGNVSLPPLYSSTNSNTCPNGLTLYGTPGSTGNTINCMYGNNTLLPAIPLCTPNNTNIATTNTYFSFLYDFTNLNCSGSATAGISFQAMGSYQPYTYSLFDGTTTTPSVTSPINNLTAGDYIITATDAIGCSATLGFHIGQPDPSEHCCSSTTNPTAGSDLVNIPDMIIYTNPNASQIANVYGSTILSKKFYFSGTFTVDVPLTFSGCELYFTPNAEIVKPLPSGSVVHELEFSGCKLRAGCDWWGGISVISSSLNKISVNNGSLYKNSRSGIYIQGDAICEINNNTFQDNGAQNIWVDQATQWPNPSLIVNNKFTTATNLPLPYPKNEIGIFLSHVDHINIGHLPFEFGNKFENMYTGILIVDDIPSTQSHIGIYNCSFTNLKADPSTSSTPDADLINSAFTNWYGAGIMYVFNQGWGTNTANLDVRNSNPANANLAFSECDKGIVTIQGSLRAENLYMTSVPMGMLNYNVVPGAPAVGDVNSFDIQNCELWDTYLGIQLNGEGGNSVVKNNKVHCTAYPNGIPTTTAATGPHIWPIGIEVNYYTPSPDYPCDIKGNYVLLPQYAGLGISATSPTEIVTISNNTVDLTHQGSGIQNISGSTTLAGISVHNALGCSITNNLIQGATSSTVSPYNVLGRIDASGIQLEHGENQQVNCNTMIGNRFGLLGISENNTGLNNELLVKGNYIENADAGWVFRHLSTEGTLGNVGDMQNDNNNQFAFLNTNAKVFKFCENMDNYYLSTMSINQFTESWSLNTMNNNLNDCFYQIQPNPSANVYDLNNCLTNIQLLANMEMSISEALSIVNNTKTYIEFPLLGHWFDCKRLMRILKDDISLRNSHLDLLAFYNTSTNSAISKEEITDSKLKHLLVEYISHSATQRDILLSDAEVINTTIDNMEIQDANERNINALYFKQIRNGINSLDATDKEFIKTLAPQCPYLAGKAVYKARTLNKYYNPGATFDDIKTCNAVGVYKPGSSGNNLIDQENYALSHLMPRTLFEVYPTPANEEVNIRYTSEEETRFEIMDITGRIVKTILLPNGSATIKVGISNLSTGVYTYKQINANQILRTGKILVD